MNRSNRCPKCGCQVIAIRDEEPSPFSKRITRRHERYKYRVEETDAPVGQRRLCVCTQCGYLEEYVVGITDEMWPDIVGVSIVTSADQGPYR